MSSSNCCFLTCIQNSQEAGQVVLYTHLFQNFPQFIVIHTVKGFGKVNKAEIYIFLELSSFFVDPANVGNLISGSSAFSKFILNIWNFLVQELLKSSLIILSITLLVCFRWVQLCRNMNILWHCFLWDWNENWPFPVLWPLFFFSEFAGILSAALSQHHLLGFGIAQLEFHHLYQLCSYWCFLSSTWLWTSGCLSLGEQSHHCSYLVIWVMEISFV